ncbi:Translin [Lineolata rhizophorae]|uniref:Translin n=1 Tax=Lineolata rhizophorae TaxID=578093 RepID=A0A6A6NPP7_9PEZI|nr:Translin [Lineolata rhizophorae]
MIDRGIFEDLQARVDEDAEVRDEIRVIVDTLEKKEKIAQSILAKAHSTPLSQLSSQVLEPAKGAIQQTMASVDDLSAVASAHPYYKWNNMWQRQVQDLVFHILLFGWLGGSIQDGSQPRPGYLLTIDEIGGILKVPVNEKQKDTFHIAIEEYLHALISLLDELARLARNSVTLGDYRRPTHIAQFIKDIHAGFQILNLKNDSLRRRSDGIKYRVKEVEDVVYDLSLRNLIPRDDPTSGQ